MIESRAKRGHSHRPALQSLDDIELGDEVTIASVGGARPFRRRLMEMGLLPGTRVIPRKRAPFGDPLELSVRGASISIRRAEARHIMVSRNG